MTDARVWPAPVRPDPPPPRSGAANRVLRLAGAFVVGSVAAPAVGFAALAVAFGGVAVGVITFAVAVVVGALLLGLIHRATSDEVHRPPLGSSFGWGLGVLLASVVLVVGCAIWWQLANLPFGPAFTPWWLLSGFGVALVAALCTRGLAVPAFVVLVALAVGLVAIAGVPDSIRSSDGQQEEEEATSSGLSRALIYVTSVPGYDDGQITTDSPGSTILYVPIDEPVDDRGPDLMIRLTGQYSDPADCGRTDLLPFDNRARATCEQLAPDLFYRATRRYHEVVSVQPTVVITATATTHVTQEQLRSAVAAARPATDAEVDRLYKGWVLDP